MNLFQNNICIVGNKNFRGTRENGKLFFWHITYTCLQMNAILWNEGLCQKIEFWDINVSSFPLIIKWYEDWITLEEGVYIFT